MRNGNLSRLVAVYVAPGTLAVTGIFLILSGAFAIGLGFLEPHGRHGAGGLRAMSTLGTFILADGAGFLMPQMWTKILSAVVLTSGVVYIFCVDASRRENWWIYCLLCLPLLLTLSLRRAYMGSPIREQIDAN